MASRAMYNGEQDPPPSSPQEVDTSNDLSSSGPGLEARQVRARLVAPQMYLLMGHSTTYLN